MTVSAYIGRRFNHSHENEAFSRLYTILKDELHDQNPILVGNFSCGGDQIDAMVLKSDSIILIDFKNYGGEVVYSENGPWKIGGLTVRGGDETNPLQQIWRYKRSLINWLRENSILENDKARTHVQGLVLFHDPILVRNSPSHKLSYWFGIADFTSAGRWLYNRASPLVNMSPDTMMKIVEALGVHETLAFGTKRNEAVTDEVGNPAPSESGRVIDAMKIADGLEIAIESSRLIDAKKIADALEIAIEDATAAIADIGMENTIKGVTESDLMMYLRNAAKTAMSRASGEPEESLYELNAKQAYDEARIRAFIGSATNMNVETSNDADATSDFRLHRNDLWTLGRTSKAPRQQPSVQSHPSSPISP